MADKTELSDQLIYGIDFKARRIHFGVGLDHTEPNPGDFSGASVEMAVRAIYKMVQDAPNKPIEIYMNSYGGDPYAMLYLMDVILSQPCQFKFFGGGAIMSSATWIMVVCDERNLFPNASVMVHDGSIELPHKSFTDFQIDAKEQKSLQERLNKIYAENSRMPEEFWADIVQRDVYLSAEEAVMLGLADKVVEYKKRGNLRKVRQAVLNRQPDAKEFKKLVKEIYQRIDRLKVPHIELNTPRQEEIDPKIVIDSTPMAAESSPKDIKNV